MRLALCRRPRLPDLSTIRPSILFRQMHETRACPSRSPSLSDRPDKKPRLETEPVHDITTELPGAVILEGTFANTNSAKAGGRKGKRKQKRVLPEPYSAEFVVAQDVATLLGEDTVGQTLAEGTEWDAPFDRQEEVELMVSAISSTGDSLSIAPSPKRPWVVVTPLALPGERIRVRVYRSARLYSCADLLEVITPNPEWRDMSRVRCRYFGKCAGCQYQMLSYEKQLDLKRDVVVKAYKNFSGLPGSSVPTIEATIASPLQYGYRTKITPHFDAPPKSVRKGITLQPQDPDAKPDWLKIGFNQIGTRKVMDIEECPIATSILNEALGPLRGNIIKNIHNYKKGVSLLLRDSLERPPSALTIGGSRNKSPSLEKSRSQSPRLPTLSPPSSPSVEKHVCVTDHNATVREQVGDKLFEYVAGSFFQNNNSVLLPLTSYVRDAIFASSDSTPKPTHLVDAYCGSGLFAISLAPHFQKVAGIELSEDSIRCATHNAQLNGLTDGQCSFMSGDASNIFATVQDFPREHTVLIIDPPRKGTDEKFIEQMLQFGCSTVVYVSCNVHTQARDVGIILAKSENMGEGRKYVLETLRGFDLFPQTAHVESVAVMRLQRN